MDIVRSIEKRYFPNFQKQRYIERRATSLELKTKCLKDPSSLKFSQINIILDTLHHFKLLPNNQAHNKRQAQFLQDAAITQVYVAITSFLPFFIRETYRLPTIYKGILIFAVGMGAQLYLMLPNYYAYMEYNAQRAKQYIRYLNESIEEQQQTNGK